MEVQLHEDIPSTKDSPKPGHGAEASQCAALFGGGGRRWRVWLVRSYLAGLKDEISRFFCYLCSFFLPRWEVTYPLASCELGR